MNVEDSDLIIIAVLVLFFIIVIILGFTNFDNKSQNKGLESDQQSVPENHRIYTEGKRNSSAASGEDDVMKREADSVNEKNAVLSNTDDWDDDDDYDWDDDADDEEDEEDEEDDDLYDYIDKTDYKIQVTANEFREIKVAVKQLLKLCHLLSADSEMRQFVLSRANDKDTSKGEYDMDQFFTTLKFLLAKDIVYTYDHLGYNAEMDFYKPEGQSLLAIIKTLNEDEDNNYPAFKRLIRDDDGYTASIRDNYEKMLDIYKNQTDAQISAKGIDEFSLVLIIVFSRQEERYLKKARKALYQLASTIVNVTGKSDRAKAFLNEMIEREKDDEDEPDEQDKTNDKEVEYEPPATMTDLQQLIGLAQVKKEVMAMKNFIEVNRRREQEGMKTPPVSYHCVFTGNPGTGKTTVARIVAGIYKELGILTKGHLVETDRSGLVAEYVGQTAVKTNKVIDTALDGVLFIDEAYSLVGAGNEDFGKEAIATLVKRMEDNRDRLVVILAGYEDEMQQFIDSNPGLRSRFNRYIHFEDYSAEELKQIFLGMLLKYDFVLQAEGEQVLTQHLKQCVDHKGKDFGNARYVRNLFERTIKAQAVRLAAQPEADKSQLALITAEDISIAIADNP